MADNLVHFLRKRDYQLVRELGQGACGKTVLLQDDVMNEAYVCKKYAPYSEDRRQELFTNFVREIKLLHKVHHRNVVRFFNYYLYPESLTGYILMEYVDGSDVEEYLKVKPEQANDVFLQAIEGFRYLELNGILHRDIRPQNLLVSEDGIVKIIDLGFGKSIQKSQDFDKSISLNWWCTPPSEFSQSVYDFRTEVYFVGKLFERIVENLSIDSFKYESTLREMCQWSPENRLNSFFDVQKRIQNNLFFEIKFEDDELQCYRDFADQMAAHITRIESGTKYIDDLDKIKLQLESGYKGFMLEQEAADAAPILRCFLDGSYYYRKSGFSVAAVRKFLHLLKGSTQEKQRVILSNLHTRLDAITRYKRDVDDEVPF